MKHFIKAAVAAPIAAMALASTPASAIATISCDDIANPTTCTYGNDQPNTGAGTEFTDLFTFILSFSKTLSGDIFSQYPTSPTDFSQNVNFNNPQGVRVQGGTLAIPQNFTVDSLGVTEARSISNLVLGPGTYQLRVNGTSGANGQYSGNLVFGSVPEPAAWAFLILGFGLIGGAMRSRKSNQVRAAFA